MRANRLLCLILSLAVTGQALAFEDDRAYGFQSRFSINDFQSDLNLRQFNYRPQFDVSSFDRVKTPYSPNLTLNSWTMQLPEMKVSDLGNSLWTFERLSSHSTPQTNLVDRYQADIKFQSSDEPASGKLSMEISQMKFDHGSSAPKEFRQAYRDEQGNTLVRERTNQISQTNDSFNHFIQLYENESRLAEINQSISPTAVIKRRPADPTTDLVTSFDEKWNLKLKGEDGVSRLSKVNLHIDSIEHETDLNRFISGYSGNIQANNQQIKFTVASPHSPEGEIQSLSFHLEGKGAPSATINWIPVPGKSDEAFSLLRENMPVPILIGPRSNFRLNGVDLAETPLHITAKGDLSAKQLGRPQDLANLLGKEELGISVSFSIPEEKGFSISSSVGNSIRNAWYMVTGQWAEVKGIRQQLSLMEKENKGKFILAAGFSSPSQMGINDLRTALENSKRIYLPEEKKDAAISLRSKESEASGYRIGLLSRALEILLTPIGAAVNVTVDVIKTGMGIVFGGRYNQEPLKGHHLIANPADRSCLATSKTSGLDYYLKDSPDPEGFTPSAIFDIRNDLKTPALLNILPHSSIVSLGKGSNPSHAGVYFNKLPIQFIDKLKTSNSIDLYFHGYNVGTNKSLDIQNKFSKLLDRHGYQNINALITWSGDVGNNFLAKAIYFNRAVSSAGISWKGVLAATEFIRTFNPEIKINATTHSLGAGPLLEAASRGVKFNTVILIVPAVDNEALSVGGKYEKALQNIDQLIVVYSGHQDAVFIPYRMGRFDRALGDVGPSSPVNHPNFIAIDASSSKKNPEYGITDCTPLLSHF